MGRLFGTDGVRGWRTGTSRPSSRSAWAWLLRTCWAGRGSPRTPPARGDRPRPRASGEFLGAAVTAGLASAGVNVLDVGVLPTPAVAFLTSTLDVDFGVMISASHNPMADNGIKFLARGGIKLEDSLEDAIESQLDAAWDRPLGAEVGRVLADTGSAGPTTSSTSSRASAPRATRSRSPPADRGRLRERRRERRRAAALRAAGADVVVMNASPDGRNINEKCGSNHPEQLQAVVVASEADFGVAFDGDADRCVAVDHRGVLVDGDQIMGVLALAERDKGRLHDDTLVVTVMSNLGLILAMREAGIRTVQTGVGDRYVLEEMRANGYTLGGEQSGHIILSQFATTGDGVLTALQLAARIQESGTKLADLAGAVPSCRRRCSTSGVDKARAATDEVLQEAVAAAEEGLGETGRVVLRSSGTEPLVRVMVEAATQAAADAVAESLAGVVRTRLAL
ncbi:phosphoglucosamine mutase [Oerskovia sp. M15]